MTSLTESCDSCRMSFFSCLYVIPLSKACLHTQYLVNLYTCMSKHQALCSQSQKSGNVYYSPKDQKSYYIQRRGRPLKDKGSDSSSIRASNRRHRPTRPRYRNADLLLEFPLLTAYAGTLLRQAAPYRPPSSLSQPSRPDRLLLALVSRINCVHSPRFSSQPLAQLS
jgi:hypothetical protein